jgi:hypothetical protein
VKRRLPCILATLLLLTCAACRAPGGGDYHPRVGLWPLVRYWEEPETERRRLEVLGPLVEVDASPEKKAFFLRPLYNRRDVAREVVESDIVWPFGSGTQRPDLSRWVLYPVALFAHETDPARPDQWRFILLPLLLWRQGRAAPTDFMLFPLYGRVRNILGRDEWRFGLWPLFMFVKIGPQRSWSFPFPVLGLTRFEDGGGGFKFWPLFGWKNRPDKLRYRFVLWPFYIREWRKVEQGEYRKFFCFPFYGRIDAPRGYSRTVLWPFFGTKKDENKGYQDWWYPWPFLGHRRGEGVAGRTFWPLVTWDRRPHRRYVNFLWPLGWYRRKTRPGGQEYSLRVVPFVLREWEQDWEHPDRRHSAWQLWPLMKHRESAAGEVNFEIPSVWPYRYHHEFERNWAPFFRVFSYRRGEDGRRTWRFLWRVVRVDTGTKLRYVEVLPLFKVHAGDDGLRQRSWSVLKGLVARRVVAGRRQWRFLWFLRFGASDRTLEQARRP